MEKLHNWHNFWIFFSFFWKYDVVLFCGEYWNAKREKKKIICYILNVPIVSVAFFLLKYRLNFKTKADMNDMMGFCTFNHFWPHSACRVYWIMYDYSFFVSLNFISTLNLICDSSWIYDDKTLIIFT